MQDLTPFFRSSYPSFFQHIINPLKFIWKIVTHPEPRKHQQYKNPNNGNKYFCKSNATGWRFNNKQQQF
jgi:hypothetical protein